MKVLLISAHAPPIICGVGDYTEILTKHLNFQNIKATHVALTKSYWPRFLIGLRIILKVRKAISKISFDLIHLEYEPFSMEQSYLLLIYLASRRQPLVVTFHEVFQKNIFQNWRDRTLLKKAGAIIVNDHGRFESILKLWPGASKKLHCLWVGSNLPRPQSEVPVQRYKVGYFGFINGVKRLDILMKSFKIINTQFPKARLCMVGAFDKSNSDVKKWCQWAAAEGLTDSIDWCGPQSRQVSSEKILQCELILLPFSDGASPRRGSLQAALFLGKALLTSSPASVEPNLNGLTFVQSLNPEEWAQQAITILKDENLREQMETKSLEISQKFSWEKLAQRHLKVYLEILHQKK